MMKYHGTLDIFPTTIHRFKVDHDLIDKTLSNIDLEGEVDYMEVFNDPKFSDMQDVVLKTTQKLCSKLTSRSKEDDWNVVGSWLNVQKPQNMGYGDDHYLGYHNHIDSFVSGVLYLKGSNMSLSFRDEPRLAAKNISTPVDYDIIVRHTWHPDVTIPVNVGDLLLFPSYILHEPNRNEKKEHRVSIAYNFMPSRTKSKHDFPWTMDLRL